MATDRLINSTQGDGIIEKLALIASKIGVEGGVYSAGTGVNINDDVISVDTTTIPTISSISSTYLTQTAAANTYLTQSAAAATYLRTVDTADIVSGAVTWGKLSSDVQSRINSGGGGTADLSGVSEMIDYIDISVTVTKTTGAYPGSIDVTITAATGIWGIYEDTAVTVSQSTANDDASGMLLLYGYIGNNNVPYVGVTEYRLSRDGVTYITIDTTDAIMNYDMRIYKGDIDERLKYLENNALTSIPDSSISAAKIVDSNVTWGKLSADVQSRINNSGIQVEPIVDIDDFIDYDADENVESVRFGEYNGTNYKIFVIGTNYNNKFVQYKLENDGIHYRLGTLSAITEMPEWGMWTDISSGGGGGTDSRIGDLSNLTTTAKSTVVAAINEVDGDIGNLSALTTTAKSSAVAAINEINSVVGQANAALETLINSGV